MALAFAVTWDYRCPFARNVHEHLLIGLQAGGDWDLEFRPFSLDQAHLEEGDTPVWDEPDRYPGLLANLAGIVVRDRQPEHFATVHRALFAARHDQARDTRQWDVVAAALSESGVDAGAVKAEIDGGWPLDTFRQEHTKSVDEYQVFGVPTFIAGGRAVFVRLMSRPGDDHGASRDSIERVVDQVTGWSELNEFKATSIPL